MNTANFLISLAIAAYLALMVIIGIIYSKRSSNDSANFYLGGRGLNPIVAAMSAEASDMSSWLLMGLPGVAYITGVADAFWTAAGLAIGTYLNWLIVAKRLRLYTERIGAITVPEFISLRFGDKKNILRAIAALIIIIFFIPYTASGFAAVGKLFRNLFDFDYTLSMLAGAAVIIVYTILGGFLAVSTTDLIQSIVMTFALLCVLVFGIRTAGGWGAVCENAKHVAGYLSLTELGNSVTGETSSYSLLSIISTMAWGLGYFGMPHILLRFMGINNPNKVKISRRIASVWVIISMGVAIMIGIVGYACSKSGAIVSFSTQSEAESTIVKLAYLLSSNGAGFALIAGLVLAGILACTMSTADSQLLAASSSVSEDIVGGLFGIKMTEKKTMWLARATVIVISLISVLLARNPDSSVFGIVSFAWAGFGAAFAPVILLALFWRRANGAGAFAGMISGGVMVFVWHYLVKPMGGVWGIYELLPAFIVAIVLDVIVSLASAAPAGELTAAFDEVKKNCKGSV